MFIVVRSWMVNQEDKASRITSETPFKTKAEADVYVRELVELNPGVTMDFFIKEVS